MQKKIIKLASFCFIMILLSACSHTDKETNGSDTAKNAETIESTETAESTETTESTEITESVETTESDETAESTETAESVETANNAEAEITVDKSSETKEIVEMSSVNEWEEFCRIQSYVCGGICFDKEGNMLVARPDALDKVTPDGTVTMLYDFSGLERGKSYNFISPFIWDMKYDNDNNLIAAAQDRIIKITEDGNVTTLIREDFNGFLGASGLEIDKEGNLYVVSGGKVYRYSSDLSKSEYISSSDYDSFFSIAFSPDYNYLYLTDFHTKALIKCEIKPDGSVGKCTEIVRDPVKKSGAYGAPLNMIFSESGNMYVSIDGKAHILKVDQNDNLTLIDLNEPVSNHILVFGNEKFGKDQLYFTTYDDKVCKIQLDENNELR